jgi:hypothetical protein
MRPDMLASYNRDRGQLNGAWNLSTLARHTEAVHDATDECLHWTGTLPDQVVGVLGYVPVVYG